MKKLTLLFLTASMMLLLPYSALATEQGDMADMISPYLEASEADRLWQSLPDATKRSLQELGLDEISPQNITELQPGSVFEEVWQSMLTALRSPFATLTAVTGVVILSAFLEGVGSTATGMGSSLSQVFSVVSSVTICAAIALPVIDCITSTAEAITNVANFMLSFLPIFTGVITAGGQPITASTYHIFLFWICQVIAQFSAGTLVPLMGIYLGISVASSAAPSLNLSGTVGLIKTILSWAMGLMMTIFVGLLTISSIVSSSGDTVSVKTARFLIGSFVPVVGGALSEAFAAAQGCVRLLKTTLGAYGVIGTAAIFLPVISRLVAWYVTINISGVLSEVLSLSKISALLKSVAATLGLLLAMVLCFALLLIISTTIMLMVGQGVG